GAVFVFLHPTRFSADRAPTELARTAFLLACAIPLSHVGNIAGPFVPLADFPLMEVLSVAVSTSVLAVPFVLAGVAITIALTRCGGPISRLYALDLTGAAVGCLLVV